MTLRPPRICALALLAPLACTVRPIDGDSGATEGSSGAAATSAASASATDPTTTAAPTTTSTTAQPASTSADPETTAAPPPDAGGLGQPCDPWIEDCPAGQKCMPYSDNGGNEWTAYKCVPIVRDPAGLDEPCNVIGSPVGGEDTCDKHMMCWDVDTDIGIGHCVGMCTGTPREPGCADPDARCIITDAGVLILCLPTCDPLLQDCENTQVCVPNPFGADFLCATDASGSGGEVFDACEFLNACKPGLACLASELAAECDPNASGCCLPFCDLNLPPDCPGQGQQCVGWFPPGEAPAGVEDVGVCVIPP